MSFNHKLCNVLESLSPKTSRNTHRVSQDFLCLESVDEPHGDVADEEEGDGLAGGLAAFLFWQVDATAGYIGDE